MIRKRSTFTIVPVAGAVLLLSIFVFDCRTSFAEGKHPSEGTVHFGADTNPAVASSAGMQAFRTVFADVAAKVVPTVVSVIPTKIDTVVFQNNPFYDFFNGPGSGSGDDPFQFFFGNPHQRGRGDQGEQEEQPRKEERRMQGLGSGVIVSPDGYILTNFHVVSGADEIEVKLTDGREYEAAVVGSDSLADVAVIRIKDKVSNLPVAYIGDSDKLRPGDWVMAIGNPFSLTSTVTVGIVSALNRSVSGGSSYQSFIQTDAAINPGNSGGALVNIDGSLVGINTMIYSNSGGNMGIGFAIPITMAKRIMQDLIYHGEVTRGWIGVSIQDIDPATRDAMGLKNTSGVLIADAYKGEPADKAGIKGGDIVTSINGKAVASANDLRNAVAEIEPNTKVPVELFRQGKKLTVQLTVARRNEAAIEKLAGGEEKGGGTAGEKKEHMEKQLGLQVENLTGDLRSKYGIGSDVDGVVITSVDRSLPDARAGLKLGDVVRQVKTQKEGFVDIHDVKDFTKATSDIKKGDATMLLIQRANSSFYVAFKLR